MQRNSLIKLIFPSVEQYIDIEIIAKIINYLIGQLISVKKIQYRY